MVESELSCYKCIRMKAAVLESINSPLVVDEVGLGELAHGQVLVKILTSGICGAQIIEIGGHKGNAKFTPHLLGHEGCGIVEDIGEGVTRVKKGDKVVLHWRKGDGVESDFPVYSYKGKPMPSGKVTTFSEFTKASENRVTPVPADTDNDLCALLGCGLSTALGVVENEARIKPGETVMIVGFGGLGSSILKAALLAEAGKIIVVDVSEAKRSLALSLGAHVFINALKEDLTETADVILETSGNSKSIERTLPLLNGGGRFIMVGQPKPGESIEIKNANHFFGGEGKTIKATQGGVFSPTVDIPKYLKLFNEGKLKVHDLITHRIKLDQINDAIDLMQKGQTLRIMIDL